MRMCVNLSQCDRQNAGEMIASDSADEQGCVFTLGGSDVRSDNSGSCICFSLQPDGFNAGSVNTGSDERDHVTADVRQQITGMLISIVEHFELSFVSDH